jgi:hypothetical protein
MVRNPDAHFFFQILINLLMLTIVSIGFVITWALYYLQAMPDRKRPGLNIKEF